MTRLLALLLLTAADGPVEVEPAQLARRTDLVGREVIVDDRVKLFLQHEGRGFDEVLLKRTPVVFRLPPLLRSARPPDPIPAAVRIKGTLRQTPDGLAVDVLTLEPWPDDLQRLEDALDRLPRNDAEGRAAWAAWAERRGREFQDQPLLERARAVAAEALRVEAERPGPDRPAHWLKLAARAKGHGLDVDAAALAHRGFRGRLASLKSADDAARLVAEIEAFFPESARPNTRDLAAWLDDYQAEPASTYRRADPDVRAALDRRLLADAWQKRLELAADADPRSATTLAEQARARLPERPQAAEALEQRGLEARARDVAALRRDEVEQLAARFRARNQPDRARAVLRAWLDDQRQNRLSRDAVEGRADLAELFVALLGDRETADTLLREAERINPRSRSLIEAFGRLGYRKTDDQWHPPDPSSPAASVKSDVRPEGAKDSLLQATRKEVRAQLGQPDRVSRLATQGQVVEQWLYLLPRGGVRYLNFVRVPGRPEPTVQRHGNRP